MPPPQRHFINGRPTQFCESSALSGFRKPRRTALRIPVLSLYSRTVVRLAQSTGLSGSSQYEQLGGGNGPQSAILFADGQPGERFASDGGCVGESHSP